ncbi:MAG: hypothetical protein V7L23_15440 [Nostoc sp.]|uniref:hypothetical protein n=1 Tax=Nostoc sp. TaxID=1180 RepID=UPI002FF39AB8
MERTVKPTLNSVERDKSKGGVPVDIETAQTKVRRTRNALKGKVDEGQQAVLKVINFSRNPKTAIEITAVLIKQEVKMSNATVRKHLKALVKSGLILTQTLTTPHIFFKLPSYRKGVSNNKGRSKDKDKEANND